VTDLISIAVLGAGNAGRALAGDLARIGADVVLWNRTPDHVAEIAEVGGVELEGEVTGFGHLRRVTSDLGEALAACRRSVTATWPRHARRTCVTTTSSS
jgi:glycerol-3-phosphate dehydrogenase